MLGLSVSLLNGKVSGMLHALAASKSLSSFKVKDILMTEEHFKESFSSISFSFVLGLKMK